MDGFQGNTGVIVIAATNIPDVLDKALLRPGRFDRQVRVDLPNNEGRYQILKVHSENKKLSSEVCLKDLAKRCLGMSGADLSNLLNEAAIICARRNSKEIDSSHIAEAMDKIQIGL